MSLARYFFILTAAMLFMAVPSHAAMPGKDLSGLWYTEDQEGVVELYSCGKAVCGRLYWMKPSPESQADRDDKNPDPQLRSRPLCGLEFMGGFIPVADGTYESGWIYSPRHGAMFSASIAAGADDTLELRGYLLLPLLGQTQRWTRATNIQPCAGLPPRH